MQYLLLSQTQTHFQLQDEGNLTHSNLPSSMTINIFLITTLHYEGNIEAHFEQQHCTSNES